MSKVDMSMLVFPKPKSCSECGNYRGTHDKNLLAITVCKGDETLQLGLFVSDKKRHPQCPLQPTTELLEALEKYKMIPNKHNVIGKIDNITYNKLYKALGDKDESTKTVAKLENGLDKRKNAVLRNLLEEMDINLGVEGTVEYLIDEAMLENDALIDDAGDYVFDIYELISFVRHILGSCEKFIESFIEEG